VPSRWDASRATRFTLKLLAQRIFTQRRRGAQRRRGLLAGSRSRCGVPLHPRLSKAIFGGRHPAVRGAAALLRAPQPPRLRVTLPFQQQTATATHAELAEERGGAENCSPGRGARSRAPFLSTHDSKSKTLRSALSRWWSRGLSQSSAPLRPSASLRETPPVVACPSPRIAHSASLIARRQSL
jgi:hypothetical protein